MNTPSARLSPPAIQSWSLCCRRKFGTTFQSAPKGAPSSGTVIGERARHARPERPSGSRGSASCRRSSGRACPGLAAGPAVGHAPDERDDETQERNPELLHGAMRAQHIESDVGSLSVEPPCSRHAETNPRLSPDLAEAEAQGTTLDRVAVGVAWRPNPAACASPRRARIEIREQEEGSGVSRDGLRDALVPVLRRPKASTAVR